MDKIPKDCTGENLRDNIGRSLALFAWTSKYPRYDVSFTHADLVN